MKDIVKLNKNEQFTIKCHLVQTIEVLPEARSNIITSDDKLISIFINQYSSLSLDPVAQTDQSMIFEDRITVHKHDLGIEFIFRYIKGHIIITKVEIIL